MIRSIISYWSVRLYHTILLKSRRNPCISSIPQIDTRWCVMIYSPEARWYPPHFVRWWYTKSATWIKKYCRKFILFCSIFWLITGILIQSIKIKGTVSLWMYSVEHADPQFLLACIGIKSDFWISIKDYLPPLCFCSVANIFGLWFFDWFAFAPTFIGIVIMDVRGISVVIDI